MTAEKSNNIANAITPLEGEAGIPSLTPAKTSNVSWKGILAVTLLILSLVAVSALSVNRVLSGRSEDRSAASKRVGDRPAAAAAEARQLDMTPSTKVAGAGLPTGPRIPAIAPTVEDALTEPIGVRRTDSAAGRRNGAARVAPEDAPVMLVSDRPGSASRTRSGGTRDALRTTSANGVLDQDDPLEGTQRNLEAYQRQLQSLLATVAKTSDLVSGDHAGALPPAPDSPGIPLLAGAFNTRASGGLFDGELQGSATPRVAATTLASRSLTLPKGTAFTCALKTKVVSAASGFVGCQVQRNVYGDDGRVLLLERGSHMDGEYRITSVRPGMVRIPVLWTRIRTPHGVTVDIDSPGTGPLGESGIDGHVDNRWSERIGAAMLLSLIDDSVKLVIQNQASDRGSDTIVLPSTTDNASKLAEKVLGSTINIPPLIYQNQGGIVGIYVARDVDFSSVYQLEALPR